MTHRKNGNFRTRTLMLLSISNLILLCHFYFLFFIFFLMRNVKSHLIVKGNQNCALHHIWWRNNRKDHFLLFISFYSLFLYSLIFVSLFWHLLCISIYSFWIDTLKNDNNNNKTFRNDIVGNLHIQQFTSSITKFRDFLIAERNRSSHLHVLMNSWRITKKNLVFWSGCRLKNK